VCAFGNDRVALDSLLNKCSGRNLLLIQNRAQRS
jgi:hypothetical protein